MALGAWLVMGAVVDSAAVTAPSSFDNLSGTVNIEVDFSGVYDPLSKYDGNVNITFELWNLTSDWVVLDSPTNVSDHPYQFSLITTNFDDLYDAYILRVTVTNASNAGDVNVTLITNLTIDNDGATVAITAPASGPLDGLVNHTINATYDTSASGINVTACSYIVYSAGYAANLTPLTLLTRTLDDNVTGYAQAILENQTIPEGAGHILVVNCTDIVGVSSNDTLSFGYDTSDPVAQLEEFEYAGGAAFNILGNATDAILNVQKWNITIQNASETVLHCNDTSAVNDSTFCAWNTQNGSYPDGNFYNVTLTVEDVAGHTATTTLSNITVDNTAPTVYLMNESFNSTVNPSVSFNFTDSLSENASCTLYVDGVSTLTSDPTTNKTPTIFGPVALADASYVMWVNCTDEAGNENNSSNITIVVDKTAPVVTIVNASFLTNSATPTVTFNYTDNISTTANCTVYFDGVAYGTDPATAEGVNTDLTANDTLPSAAYTVTVNCTEDTFGGWVGESAAPITVTVDTVGPTVIAVDSENVSAAYNEGDVLNITVTFNEPVFVTGAPTLELETGPTNRDAVYGGNESATLWFLYTVQAGDIAADLNVTGPSALDMDGVTIKDAAGNDADPDFSTVPASSLEDNKDIVIDTANPSGSYVTPSAGTYRGVVNFTAQAGDLTSGVSAVVLNNGTTITPLNYLSGTPFDGFWTENINTALLPDGEVTYSLNVTDAAGNRDAAADTVTIIIDNTKPTIGSVTPVTATYNNTGILSVSFTASDYYAATLTCNLSATNGTDEVTNSSSTLNANVSNTLTLGTVTPLTDGTWTWNVTCHDQATLMGSGAIGNTNATANRWYYVDSAPININEIKLKEPDVFVSDASPNDAITVMVRNTTPTTGADYITVDFGNITLKHDGAFDQLNATWNATSGYYEVSVNVTDVTLDNFNAYNITVFGDDGAGNGFSVTGPGYKTVILYNFTRPVSDVACLQFGTETTDLSVETNFSDVNYIIDIEYNGSADCNEFTGTELPWGPVYQDVLLMDFDTIDLTDPAAGPKLGNLGTAIELGLKLPGMFGESRIFFNSTQIAELNTLATLEFYYLPFTSEPSILEDVDAAGVDSVSSWDPNDFEASWGVSTGNLTFIVNGFSGYNMTDDVVPTIVVNAPTTAENISANTTTIDVTLNGTGTMVSYAVFTVEDHAFVYNWTSSENTANCTFSAPGSEDMDCVFTTPELADGDYTLSVTVYDFGPEPAGNTASESVNFTLDTTAPVLVVTQPEDNGYRQSNFTMYGTVTDATSGVDVVEIYLEGDGWSHLDDAEYNETTHVWTYDYEHAGAEGDVENFRILAYDFAGNTHEVIVENVTIDDTPPIIANVSNASITYQGATISWDTDELANTSVNYGTTTALGTKSNLGTLALAHSRALASLSASTRYYYNVTSCDEAGNCNTSGPYNFTTSAAPVVGGGGGGGGTIPGLPFGVSPMKVQLSTSGRFAFQGPDKKVHYVSIESINADGTVKFKFTSDPVYVTLKDGETGQADVTADGVNDVVITMLSHSQYSAIVTLSKPQEVPTSITEIGLGEEVPIDTTGTTTETGMEAVTGDATAGPEAGAADTDTGAAASSAVKKSPWPWVILVVVVAVVLGLFWAVKTKRITYD